LFIQAMTSGKSPMIFGDGEQSRDFTYVADVVQANRLAATAPGVSGNVYNVACGHRTSLLQLVAHLNALLGTDIRPTHGPERAGDVRHSQADIARAKRDLRYRPTTDMVQGLTRCLEWWSHRQGKPFRQRARNPVPS
jgi:nucleoside-diphosphate-sugar epimerase